MHPHQSTSLVCAAPPPLSCDANTQVLGFARIKADAPSAAEASGWIVAGDQLLSVNDAPVVGKSLDDVGRMIIKGEPQWVVHVVVPT